MTHGGGGGVSLSLSIENKVALEALADALKIPLFKCDGQIEDDKNKLIKNVVEADDKKFPKPDPGFKGCGIQ